MAAKKTTAMRGVKEALRSLKGKTAKKPTKAKTTKRKPLAKATKKKATKKTRRLAPKKAPKKKRAPKKATKASSGQSGPGLELALEKLNDREKRVVDALNGKGSGSREIFTIDDLAESCWKSKSRAQANSWVRNSLRRLIRGGVVEKVERGQYRIADSGRKKLARAA